MQFKPAVTALVSAVALATLLSGCKKEEAAPAAQAPQVGVVTIQPQAFTLTSELPGRTSAYRVAEVPRRSTASSSSACSRKAVR